MKSYNKKKKTCFKHSDEPCVGQHVCKTVVQVVLFTTTTLKEAAIAHQRCVISLNILYRESYIIEIPHSVTSLKHFFF